MRIKLPLSVSVAVGVSLFSGILSAEPAQYLPLKIENLPNCKFWHWVKPSEGEKLTWSGGCRNGYAHGEGRANFWITKGNDPKRHSFEGLAQLGKAVKGRYQNEDGSITEGRFSDEILEGSGRQIFPNGVSISGNFSNGTIKGMAELAMPNGTRFAAPMKKRKFQGEGIAYFPNGSKAAIIFLDHKIIKSGPLTLKDGTLIDVPHKNGVANGTGSITYSSGKKYYGPVQNNIGTGKGFIRYATRARYEGEVVDGMAEGKGVLQTASGKYRIQGEFKQDVPHNLATVYFENGDRLQGRYHVGELIGESVYTRKDDVSCAGHFYVGMVLQKPGTLLVGEEKVGRCYTENNKLIFERDGIKTAGKSSQ